MTKKAKKQTSERLPSKAEVSARGAMVGAAVAGTATHFVAPPLSPAAAAAGAYAGAEIAPKLRGHKPNARELVLEARLLWEHYLNRPSKKRLRSVRSHCEMMKVSKAKTVVQERQRCMRAVRAEERRLGVR